MTPIIAEQLVGYDGFISGLVEMVESTRRASTQAINSLMTATYWEVGHRIVEFEQEGKERAGYGEALLKRLSADLVARFGRGFSERNLRKMRSFYVGWQKRPTLSAISGERQIQPTPSAKLSESQPQLMGYALPSFPLSWSHYVRLLSVKAPEARDFYEQEALRGGWTARQLDRQIGSQFFERTMLSKNKAAMLESGEKPQPSDVVTPEEAIKEPYLLEFLGLKDEYSESELEEALILKLESFLLELGGDFTFVGRQRRLRIGDSWYRIDLLFFHRRLRCLIIVDLKLNALTHADAGQMHMYCNYAREHWTLEDENPPVGLILCAEKDSAVAHYALDGLPNKVLAAEYKTKLPDVEMLAAELKRTRKLLEEQKRFIEARNRDDQ